MLGLMTSGQLWRNVIGQEYEVSVVTWGKISKTYLFRFFWASFVSREKDTPFLV